MTYGVPAIEFIGAYGTPLFVISEKQVRHKE